MSTGNGRGAGALDAALADLRLRGAIFFRSEVTESWTYESPTPGEIAGMLHPGAERLVMFHIVAAGRCWVSVDHGERHWATKGDVVVLPYGDQHQVGGSEEAEIVPIASLLDPPPWSVLPVLRYGTGGKRTDIVCGYLHSEDPLFDPSLRALPPVFVVHPPPARHPVDRRQHPVRPGHGVGVAAGPGPIARLPEALLIEVLRIHLATAPAVERGWVAALPDPVLAPAMSQLHAAPERKWTVGDLAASVAVSRSHLDERFRQVLGRSPIRYLTGWRMHVAEELLAHSDHSVATIARRVGYDSEEAFSRAFNRGHDDAPSHWRARRHPALA